MIGSASKIVRVRFRTWDCQSEPGLVRIAYFVHDLSDAAVLRRVRMLHRAGAEVLVLGFRRTASAASAVDGAAVVDLGQTFDGRFTQRALRVAGQVLRAPGMGARLGVPDVFLARNLEMLVVASSARALHAPRARLAYECLDIHRLMVSPSLAGRLLRLFERALLRRAHLLIVSSPAHLRAYFEPLQGLNRSLRLPVLILENKVLEDPPAAPRRTPPRPPGPPWRVGWFGILRCRRSFEILRSLADRHPGAVEILVGGRPSTREFTDFSAEVANAPGVTFAGEYARDDLERLYGAVHFNWAIDFFEEGANSEWLLPNRIYEGGRFGAVPIALKGAETGKWLEQHGLGLLVRDPKLELDHFFAELAPEAYGAMEERSRLAPREWFSAGQADCDQLLQALASAA